MKKLLFTLSTIILVFNFCYGQQIDIKRERTQTAISASSSWLLLVDELKYSNSWEQTSSFFKNAVSKEQWEQSLNSIRLPLGILENREILSTRYKTSLTGAPKGEYIIIIYKTKFEKTEKSIETVTLKKDNDGCWRVSGYFIK